MSVVRKHCFHATDASAVSLAFLTVFSLSSLLKKCLSSLCKYKHQCNRATSLGLKQPITGKPCYWSLPICSDVSLWRHKCSASAWARCKATSILQPSNCMWGLCKQEEAPAVRNCHLAERCCLLSTGGVAWLEKPGTATMPSLG